MQNCHYAHGRTVAVILAHPDDEVLGCGATIAKFAELGATVNVVLSLRRTDPRGTKNWKTLLEAFHSSCETLGANPVVIDPLLDEQLSQSAIEKIHDSVLPFIISSDTIITHWYGDTNQVHRGLSRAVEIGTRPFRHRKDVLLCEIATSTDQSFSGSFHPNAYVVVSEKHIEKKCKAMGYYHSEIAPGRRAQDIVAKARVRGAEAGVDYAEGFCVSRMFW